jgi:hypothetical protein
VKPELGGISGIPAGEYVLIKANQLDVVSTRPLDEPFIVWERVKIGHSIGGRVIREEMQNVPTKGLDIPTVRRLRRYGEETIRRELREVGVKLK